MELNRISVRFADGIQPQMNRMNADNSRISGHPVLDIAKSQMEHLLIPSILSVRIPILFICVHPVHLRLIGCSGTHQQI